jgi:hypothetical protein
VGEELFALVAHLEQAMRHEKLGAPVMQGLEQGRDSRVVGGQGRDLVQHTAPQRVVHRAAVVRIDEREVPHSLPW